MCGVWVETQAREGLLVVREGRVPVRVSKLPVAVAQRAGRPVEVDLCNRAVWPLWVLDGHGHGRGPLWEVSVSCGQAGRDRKSVLQRLFLCLAFLMQGPQLFLVLRPEGGTRRRRVVVFVVLVHGRH